MRDCVKHKSKPAHEQVLEQHTSSPGDPDGSHDTLFFDVAAG